MQINVNRQLERLAWRRGLFSQFAHFLAVAVDHNLLGAILPHQHLVVFQFHARLTDYVSRIVEFKLRLVQHLLADFTHVADQVRHETFARVKAAMRHDGFQLGQLVAVGFDEGLFVLRDVVLQVNRLVLRHGGESVDAIADLFGIHVQAFCNKVGVGTQVARGITHQQRGE